MHYRFINIILYLKENNMKKFLAVCLVAASLTGCANSAQETTTDTTVTSEESTTTETSATEETTEATTEATTEVSVETSEETVSEDPFIDADSDYLFITIANVLYFDSEASGDYQIVYSYGEDYDNPLSVNSRRMLTSDLEYFYSEVLGDSRTFTPNDEQPAEIGIICSDDGYCYSYMGAIGLMGYFAIDSVSVDGDIYQVEVGYYDDFDEEMDSITFTMQEADNNYGYTLVR